MESDEDEYDSFDDDEGTKQGSAPEVERAQTYLELTIRRSPVVDVAALIRSDIQYISELVGGLDDDDSWLLLAHFQFSREKLLEAILEDEDAVRRKAGVTPGPAPPDAAPSFFCSITLEDMPCAMGFALPCGHLFSQQAWRRLVHACVTDSSTDEVVFGAHCPQEGCRERIRRRVFYRFLAESEDSSSGGPTGPPSLTPLERYIDHCMRAYVAAQPGLVRCKGPGCSLALQRPPGAATMQCPEGHRFCAGRKCSSSEAHEPAACDEALRWAILAPQGVQSAWLRQNAKQCPTCRKWIERSMGVRWTMCNKIRCPCGTSFCYLCGRAPFERFHDYPRQAWDCNVPPASLYEGDDADRLAFYAAREVEAAEVATSAAESLRRIEAACDALDGILGSRNETAFLRGAARTLVASRQVLRWSWVHAFFLAQSLNRELDAVRTVGPESLLLASARHARPTGDGGPLDLADENGGDKATGVAGLAVRTHYLGPRLSAPPDDGLMRAATEHLSFRGALRHVRLFEARQGQLEGAAERLASELSAPGLEAAVLHLRSVSESARAAFILGEAPPRAESPTVDSRHVHPGASLAEVAATALAREEGGLPGLRRRVTDAASCAARCLLSVTAAEEDRTLTAASPGG